MAQHVLRNILVNIQEGQYSMMVDETMDVSNQEQVVVVFRLVDGNLDPNEYFVGLCVTDSILWLL